MRTAAAASSWPFCAKAKSVQEMWERIAPNDQQVSVIERYRQYFQEADN